MACFYIDEIEEIMDQESELDQGKRYKTFSREGGRHRGTISMKGNSQQGVPDTVDDRLPGGAFPPG